MARKSSSHCKSVELPECEWPHPERHWAAAQILMDKLFAKLICWNLCTGQNSFEKLNLSNRMESHWLEGDKSLCCEGPCDGTFSWKRSPWTSLLLYSGYFWAVLLQDHSMIGMIQHCKWLLTNSVLAKHKRLSYVIIYSPTGIISIDYLEISIHSLVIFTAGTA